MNSDIALRRFSFQRRPIPVPGDLRIAWRVALILLMLNYSRANRASLAKLHILNDAIRSEKHQHLKTVVNGAQTSLPWSLRIEPAFARAIDFVVGERFATWTKAKGRAALELTKHGLEAAAVVVALEDALVLERTVIQEYAKIITEGMVETLLGEGGVA